ncbi:GIY-YIG nuclease family protein [Candidatus Nomurabacteria bacterium]|nr:GIY-YIG nuclease family protein [Candidatus Nomurabacteria bacterium]MCB9808806.1 GIY-YIG nuclease family protein [Candidatus Nomurabacteria bacterium]MCB9808898.1 GIY-YIG nuclease family protein [Candidatus Nomurabacteria bacterium]
MKNEKYFYVYILASKRNGTLYIGITNNLEARILQHKQGKGSVFTAKYGVSILVYYEMFHYVSDAIIREKRLKKWERAWKLELIEKDNPLWHDLSLGWDTSGSPFSRG